MCGIAGIIGKNFQEKDKVIEKMTDMMIHRGPDDEGFYCDNDVALGMRRLSIIDLEKGKQPIFSEDENLVIIFNGEIYNFKELRESLLTRGHKFKTNSDTETIIHLYEEEGEECVKKLRGMFTFCIYDRKKKTLFLARDYFGIKPLYFLNKNNIFAFASEIKSLIYHPYYHPEVNDEAVYYFLSFQYVPLKETIFKDIYRLDPGSYLKIDIKNQKIEEKKYWEFSFKQENNVSEDDLLNALKNSVSHHMISDVPVGAFLSGGVDSTAIVALMKNSLMNDRISTFSVGFEEINEFGAARTAAKFLNSDHTEIKLSSSDFFEKLPELIWHFDEPVADPSAIALYFVAREARKKIKVVLSGEGADELFGGYNIYLEPFALKKLDFLSPSFRKKILFPLAYSNFNFFGKNYLRRYFTPLEERYIGNAYVFKPVEVRKIWRGQDFSEPSYLLNEYYKEIENLSDSTKMQSIDINYWLPGDILAKADKMTMANSLELRVPFLDIEVAKIASRISDEFKFKNGKTTKYLFRQSLKGLIPEGNRKRKKLGFPVPMKQWLADKNNPVLDAIFKNPYLKTHFNMKEIEKLTNPRQLYLLLTLSFWYNVFIK